MCFLVGVGGGGEEVLEDQNIMHTDFYILGPKEYYKNN